MIPSKQDLEKTLAELKTENAFNNLVRNYINDGYHLVDYNNTGRNGYIEANLMCRSNGNELRITTQYYVPKIYVYKNKKLNNTVKVSI
mgnify:CR=1 FL=1